MTIDTKDMLNSILSSIARIDYVKSKDIPNIDLYMDQITTFMEKQLRSTKRHGDDKILTKTMINNYTKNNLLPPPDKKKYSKEHVLLLIFVYYFKNLLSIKDIEALLGPITDTYFQKNEAVNLTSIYEQICKTEKDRIDSLKTEIEQMYHSSEDTFSDLPEEEQSYLQLFSFICSLSFDVYVKKQLIETLIDELPKPKESSIKSRTKK